MTEVAEPLKTKNSHMEYNFASTPNYSAGSHSQQSVQASQPRFAGHNAPPESQSHPMRLSNVFEAPLVPVGAKPCRINCPFCKSSVLTIVQYTVASKTHLLATILCVTGCVCLAPIPYFMKSCKTAHHYCPSCSTYLGSFKQ